MPARWDNRHGLWVIRQFPESGKGFFSTLNVFEKNEADMGKNRKREIEQHGGQVVDPASLSPAEILAAGAKSYTDQGRVSPRVRRALRMKEYLENPPTELPPDVPKLPRKGP